MRTISIIVVLAYAMPARADDARWRFGGELEATALTQEGIALSLGVSAPALPRWRFSLALASHDVPDFQAQLSGDNDRMYVTMPIALEAVAQYRHATGAVAGARVGMIHLHFTRLGTFGIDEEFDYGITPFVGYEWAAHRNIYVQPWLGAMVTLVRQTHGELPMQEADRTYARWPAMLRGGLAIGARW